MSIESMIENLNNTLHELVTVISRQNELISNQSVTVGTVTNTAGLTDSPTDTQEQEAVEPAKPATKKSAAKPKAEPTETAPTFAEVQTTVIDVVRKVNRDAALSILNKYNATNVSGLDPAAYPAVMKEAKALLATAKDPLAE